MNDLEAQPKPHKLTARLSAVRDDVRRYNKILRRARFLYIAICRESIVDGDSDWTINYVAKRMLETSMVSPTRCLRDLRFSILRRCWMIECNRGLRLDWHEWLKEMGYVCGSFERAIA